MKPSIKNSLLSTALLLTATLPAPATDLYWDADGATTTATGGTGTWQTASTWRSGSATGTLGNWADNNTAVFGGTNGTGYTVTLSGNINVDQIKILVGDNNATSKGVTIGATANTTNTISFGGSYSSTHAAIDTTSMASVAYGSTIAGKISGTVGSGGLYIKGINAMFSTYTTGTVGRLFLSNAANDFVGDVTIDGSSVHSLSYLGNAANKIILKNGGGLYGNSATAVDYNINRDIVVSAGGGAIGSYTANAVAVITKLANGKTISGAGNLTRYQPTGTSTTEQVWLMGGMSGYTGTFENVAGTTLIQTASTSGGAWKLTGGILKLNTTNDTHIADGSGASDLLMNGGTLDMNGKSETINGLSGSSTASIVQNQATSSTSTLTLGASDATASFGGVLRNSSGTGGTLALIKTGSGTQTLTGANLYTGTTAVNGGKLLVNGSTAASAVTVAAGSVTGTPVATLGGTGTIGGTVSLTAESAPGFKNGGVLAPTAAASGTKLSVTGTTTFGTGSIFEWNMAATTPSSDPGIVSNSGSYGQLAGTGTIGGSNAVFKIVLGAGNAFTDAFWNTNKTWNNLFTGSGATNNLTSIFSSISGADITYGSGQGTVTGEGYFTLSTTNTLTWTAVPEPTSALSALLITAGLLRRRRNVEY